MRILYVAKHGSGGNDDEGSITYALEKLGHRVTPVREDVAKSYVRFGGKSGGYDFCLFHKWADVESIKLVDCPRVFWYWDLVDWSQDLTLSSRCEARKRWMAEVTPLVDMGFVTDGDWQARDATDKLVVLRQGADERVVGFGREAERDIDVLFVGGVKGCGVQRESFLRDLQERYGSRSYWIGKGYYREELRDLVARSNVVVCPDSPVTDRYWSNRIYIMAGFGACTLHQRIYSPDFIDGYVPYDDREQMLARIDQLLLLPKMREEVGQDALDEVKAHHLYRHRCEELIQVVKERLSI